MVVDQHLPDTSGNELTEIVKKRFSGQEIIVVTGDFSSETLRELLRAGVAAHAPCGAMSSSDRVHGDQVQFQLGYRLSHWFCAEQVRV